MGFIWIKVYIKMNLYHETVIMWLHFSTKSNSLKVNCADLQKNLEYKMTKCFSYDVTRIKSSQYNAVYFNNQRRLSISIFQWHTLRTVASVLWLWPLYTLSYCTRSIKHYQKQLSLNNTKYTFLLHLCYKEILSILSKVEK